MLKEHLKEIPLKSGKIIFDYRPLHKSRLLSEKLMGLTNSYFNTKIKMIENTDTTIIEVY